MDKFELHILGCGSALPTLRHRPASQVLTLRQKLFMIDCGEGAQLGMRKSRLSFSQLNHIFISHLHGDHCFGLPGLVSTFSLLGRTAPLFIHAPGELERLLRPQLDFHCSGATFDVRIEPFDIHTGTVIYEDRSLTVTTLPLHHRLPCCGFLFREKPTLPHILRDMIDYLEIPLCEINNIKHGADWVRPDGTVVPNSRLVRPAAAPRSYAYVSDTAPRPSLVPDLKGVNLLFHEATFAESEAKRARETFHSTAMQAARIALDAQVRRLVIGHFSARYEDETPLLNEARSLFPATDLANEGLRFSIE